MKKYNTVILLSILIVLLSNNYAFSQETKLPYNNTLWLKSENTTTNSETVVNKKQNQSELNFNKLPNFSMEKIEKIQNRLVNKKSSFFIVYRSSSEKEANLFSIERNSFKALLSTKKMYTDTEAILNKGNAKTGTIVSYLFNKNSWTGKKKGNLIFDENLYGNSQTAEEIAELIYIPKNVNSKEKATIETYLSIKYGISLEENQNYLNSNNDTIWNAKENKEYRNRVTGIGRDDFFKLNQKQSKNSSLDGLTIGFDTIKKNNVENHSLITDKTFFIWGDNGKQTLLETINRMEQKRIPRIWKIKSSSKKEQTYTTQIVIDKTIMQLEKETIPEDKNFIWLAVDSLSTSEFDYNNANYIKARVNNEEKIVFDDIKWITGKDYFFTLVKAPENPNKSIQSNQIIASENTNQENWGYSIFPNPANHDENFSILFNLKEMESVNIKITDMNGRIIKSKQLGKIKDDIYKESLSVSGTYLIIITINGDVDTNKIIIK